MIEHPERTRFRKAILARNGTWYDWGQADCSQQIIDMCKGLGFDLPFTDRSSQGMYDDAINGNRPKAAMLGSLWLYGSPTNVTHVRLAYDDVVAFGAEGGSKTTNTVEQAKARCAFWRSCDPHKDSRTIQGPFMPSWYPWVRVTTANLNLRDRPSVAVGSAGNVIEVLPSNTALELLDDPTHEQDCYVWASVQTIDGERGWVASEFLKR